MKYSGLLKISFLLILLVLLVLPAAAESSPASMPVRVEVGMYVIDIAHLDLKESEFYADFYLWFKAPVTASWTPVNIEFMNGRIESATPFTHQIIGSHNLWNQRVKGRFRGHFRLQSYPFDKQTLPIIIEDSESPVNEIVFVVDPDAAPKIDEWVDPEVHVPDWKMQTTLLKIDKHLYKAEFGQKTGNPVEYSRFTIKFQLKRLFLPHVIKFILPLIIIAGMAYMVFFINASEFETQCGICVTALLSAVALHIAQADALPAVGYLVMSDKVFILFYVVIFSALVQTVVNNNFAKKRRFDMAIYLDKQFRLWYVVVLIVGNLLVFILS